ncbi:MAG: hypothetical protein R3C18_26330 [Planctomycetaceae bacterium]
MGVDFGLFRRKRRGISISEVSLPEIEARFAATEYPRFLSQLAQDAGIGETWERHQDANSAVTKALVGQASATFDPERPFGPTKKEQRRANKQRKKERREGKISTETDHQLEEMKELRQRVEETRKAIEELSAKEPLVEFLLARRDWGEFDSEACRRIGPRIRYIAEGWEPAGRGCVGWREKALEIAAAMEIAAQHSDVWFGISG